MELKQRLVELYEHNTLLENKDGFKLTTISCKKHINLKAEERE